MVVAETRDNRDSRQGKHQKLRRTHAPSEMWYNMEDGKGYT